MENEKRRVFAKLAAAGFFKRPDGKILLVKRGNGWSLPVGHMDSTDDELDLEQTLFREMLEELGIGQKDIYHVGYLGSYTAASLNNNGGLTNILIYECRVGFKVARMIRYQEKEDTGQVWLWPCQMLNQSIDRLTKTAITRHLKRRFLKRAILEVITLLREWRRALCKKERTEKMIVFIK